ncbi:MAG: hypothetical protein AABY22_33210 [Nanoarchaeota archaeon]
MEKHIKSKDPILKLVQLTEYLWNEKKGLDHVWNSPNLKKRQIEKLSKIIKEIGELQPKLEAEIAFLKDLNKIA